MRRRDLLQALLAAPVALLRIRRTVTPEPGLAELEGEVVSLDYPIMPRTSRYEDTKIGEPTLTVAKLQEVRRAFMRSHPPLVVDDLEAFQRELVRQSLGLKWYG